MLHSSRVNLASDDFHCLRCASWSTFASTLANARGCADASKRVGSALRSFASAASSRDAFDPSARMPIE